MKVKGNNNQIIIAGGDYKSGSLSASDVQAIAAALWNLIKKTPKNRT